MNVFTKINRGLLKAEEVLMVLSSIGLVLSIFAQVVCRYVFKIPTAWAEELARYMFIWLTYLGTAYAYNYSSHIQIDIADQLLDRWAKNAERAKKILNNVSIVLTMAFLLVFCYIFGQYFLAVYQTGQTSPTMRIPMTYIMSAVFVGCALTIVHGLYLLLCSFKGIAPDVEDIPSSEEEPGAEGGEVS